MSFSWMDAFRLVLVGANAIFVEAGGKAGAVGTSVVRGAEAALNVVTTKGDPAAISAAAAAAADTMQAAGVPAATLSKIASGEAMVADYAPVVGAMVDSAVPTEASHVSQAMTVFQAVTAGFASRIAPQPAA